MSKSTRSHISSLTYALIVSFLITITVYILRGRGILSFMPGGILLLLITVSIFLGIMYAIQTTRRF